MKSFLFLLALGLAWLPRLALAEESYQQENSADNSFRNQAGLTGNVRIDQFSGAAAYNINLEVPAGRNGFNPSLNLFYNSHDRSNDSWVGQGWSLPLGSITRSSRKGLDSLYTANEFNLFLNGSFREIIEIDAQNHIFAPREESDFLKIQYITGTSSWLVTDTMGNKYYFGQSNASRQYDPSDQTKIYQWNLDKVEDTNANFYAIAYAKDNNRIYPETINYTGHDGNSGPTDIVFIFEDRPDDFVSYQTQFAATTTKRLDRIEVEVSGTTTAKYLFNYAAGQNGQTSLLSSIIKNAYIGQQEYSLPTTTFSYINKQDSWINDTANWATSSIPYFNQALGGQSEPLVDFNGDSWVDRGSRLNSGAGWDSNDDMRFPEGINIVQALYGDLNGDGFTDMITGTVWLNNRQNGFSRSSSYTDNLAGIFNNPPFDYKKTALADVNADGLDDLIFSYDKNGIPEQQQARSIYLNTGSGFSAGYGSFPIPLSLCEADNGRCEYTGVNIIDLNGDGLVDIFSGNGLGDVYLNLGNGFSAEPSETWALPELETVELWNSGGARFTDLNGDGLIDILVAGQINEGNGQNTDYETAYLNNGNGWQERQNNDWESPIIISHNLADLGVRLLDLNNDGSMDVVRAECVNFNDCEHNTQHQIFLGSGAVANILSSIDNGFGGETAIEYQSSGRYFTDDNKFASPKLPLNLQTVKSIASSDGQGNEITVDYFYKDGAFYADDGDFTLNRYAGFGSVSAQTGDQITRTFYHQGSGVDGYGNGEYEDTIYKKGRPYREEAIYDDGENWNLLSAKVNTWKQEDLGNGRKFVYQDGSVIYDYDADGWAEDGPQNAPTANFNPNQAAVNNQLADLADTQAFAPNQPAQLVSQSPDGLNLLYYLGRNQNKDDVFRLVSSIPQEPERDELLEEEVGSLNGDGEMQYFRANNCPAWQDIVNGQATSYLNDETGEVTNVYAVGGGCQLSRLFLPFNTSGIPDDAIVTQASLSIKTANIGAEGIIELVDMDTNEPWMEAGRFGHVLDVSGASEDVVEPNTRYEFNFNEQALSWIDLVNASSTILSLRGYADLHGNQPAGNGIVVNFYMADAQTENNRPYLLVEYTLNHPPLVPEEPWTEGGVNPDNVADQTPEFSAIYNDDNEEDMAVGYQIQVIKEGGGFENPLWDSTPEDLASSTPSGMRIEEISYGGNNLPLEGFKYFWRVKFWDNGDAETAEGLWSDGGDFFIMDGSAAPSSSIDLLTESKTEPVELINQRPAFSAIYLDPNPIDSAKWLEIEVDNNADMSSPVWDTGKTLLSEITDVELLDNGSRLPEAAYGAQNPLPYDGTEYFWRVRFWDDEGENGTEGAWSATASFTMFDTADVLDGVAAKAVKYAYDFENGNLETEESFGQVYASKNGIYLNTDQAVTGDEKDSAYLYAAPLDENVRRILSAPKQKILTDPNGISSTSTVSIFYDGRQDNQVDKANPTTEDLTLGAVIYNKTFNSYGLVTSSEDPLGNVTDITYDASYYYPYQTTNELNHLIKTEYDLNCGQAKKITDPNNTVEERAYDAFCRLISVKKTNPGSSSLLTLQTYEYHDTADPAYVKQVNFPGQSFEQEIYTYFDGLGRAIQNREESETSGAFRVASYGYDSKGNLYRQSLPYFDNSGSAFEVEQWSTPYTQYTYDSRNRVTQQSVITNQNTYATSYLYDGWNVTVTDPNNKEKKFYKDAYGQLIRVDEYLGQNTHSTYYEYNLLGKLLKITDSLGNVRNFEYDELGRLTAQEEMHDPEAEEFGVWDYSYDDASNLTSKTDPKNQTVEYTYDDLNRLLTENYTGQAGAEVAYAYDTGSYGKGRLKTASSTGAGITYSYDKWGRITQESKTINNRYYSTSWEYSYASVPTKITYPGSFKVWYTYNNSNLPKTVRYGESSQSIVTSDPLIDSVTYSPLKQIAAIEYANDTVVTNTFDPNQAYRLTSKETINSLNDVIQDISYTYDNVGNITQTVDNSETDLAKTVAYSYDDLYRLTTASSTLAVEEPNYKETYSYDPIGNILSKTGNGTYKYENSNPYQANKINNVNQTYDNNGNLTNDSSLTFNFNWFDRLASTTLNASTTLDFLYDYSGQRTLKQQAFDTIDTEFNPITLLYTDYYPNKLYEEKISEVEGDPMSVQSEEVRHIMLGNQTIANIKRANYSNPAISLVFTDHLGSSAIVTDSLSRVKTIYDYLPYGAERNTDETYNYTTDYRFTGKELDEETNLSYFEQRYYNQDTGRFTQVDPASFNKPEKFLSDPQQLNLYSYVKNNPIVYIDPTGKEIVISDKNGSQFVVDSFKNLQKIYPHIYLEKIDSGYRVNLQPDSRPFLEKLLDLFRSDPGKKLMQETINNEHVVTIEAGQKDQYETAPANNQDAANGRGTNSTIFMDPNFSNEVKSSDFDSKTGKVDPNKVPIYIVLSHELIHSYHFMQGDVKVDQQIYQGLNESYYQAPQEEIRTVGLGYNVRGDVTENDIRKRDKLKLRNNY